MESVLAQEEIYFRYEQLEITGLITTRFLQIKSSFLKNKVNICFSKKARFATTRNSPYILFNNGPKTNTTRNKKQQFNNIIKRNISLMHSFPKEKKTTYLCILMNVKLHKRSMQNVRALAKRAIRKTFESSDRRYYANNRVFTSIPGTSSNESLNNNPPLTFPRKNKSGTVIQHPEWVRETCDQLGCNGLVCINLCGSALDRKAIAHGTHGKAPAHETDKKTVPLGNPDFSNNPNKGQNLVFYENAPNVNATQRINSDPTIINKIKKHEDKK